MRNSKRASQAYEMAFKMQTEATDAFDINKEPQKHARTLWPHARRATSC